jgi:hypothetical protein
MLEVYLCRDLPGKRKSSPLSRLASDKLQPGGTGARVRFSGFEEWQIGADGLIARSNGHFDDADYRRQLQRGRE